MNAVYPGAELELFATAINWKTYVASALKPYVGGRVLDVGAGMGGNTHYLCNASVTAWTALEPDPVLAAAIDGGGGAPAAWSVVNGTIEDLPDTARFDTILYLDVLEHIADDRGEIQKVIRMLAPGGRLVVLVPAHQFLFSAFDTAVGHFRRYGTRQLRDLTPSGFRIELCRLMDSVGCLASLMNRFVLRQSDPTARQIALWDRLMVRASRWLDPVSGYRIGKSALMVWRAPSGVSHKSLGRE